MVGRFESGDLRREALAHEALTARQGLAGKCWLLVGVFIVAVGFYSTIIRSSVTGSVASYERSTPSPSSDDVRSASTVVAVSTTQAPVSDSFTSVGSHYRSLDIEHDAHREQEDPNHLSIDFSLMALLLAALAMCLIPPLMRACSNSMAPTNFPATNPWMGFGSVGSGALGRGDLFFSQPAPSGMLLGSHCGGARDGRLVDVKPGELRGGAARGVFGTGWFDQSSGQDWNCGVVPGAARPWAPFGTPGGGVTGNGSWGSPVPSPYGVGPAGLAGTPGGAGMWPGLHGWGTPSLGFGLAGTGHVAISAHLPTEVEVNETYASVGGELQHWVPRLTHIIDKTIIEPLIQELDDSDKMWQTALSMRGWRLTTEAPRQTYPGMGPQTQEVSVFDRFLPTVLLQIDPMAADLWSRRQQLESYLLHPGFSPDQRSYVLSRLREWRDRGIQNSMRWEWRMQDQMPTDAHILENLLVKMLNNTGMEFEKCFLATPQAPPLAKHLGQSPVAYLRQVTDQTVNPKPAPHYEVFTLTKVWKLRPGNTNLFEALALLIHALKRHHSRSHQSFPQQLRNAIESNSMMNLPARLLPSIFGGLG